MKKGASCAKVKILSKDYIFQMAIFYWFNCIFHKVLKIKYQIWSQIWHSVTKKWGSKNPTAHTLATADPANLCVADWSLIYRHLSSPDSDYLPTLSLICLEMKDQQTQQHSTWHNTHFLSWLPHRYIRESPRVLFTDHIYTLTAHALSSQHKFSQNTRVW